VTINVQYIHHLSTEENFGGSGPSAAVRGAASAVFRFFFVIRRRKKTPRRVDDATRVSFAALSQNVTCKSGRRTPAIGARFERGPHLRDAPLRGLEVRKGKMQMNLERSSDSLFFETFSETRGAFVAG
jgi:hypothetical protein